MSQPFLKDSVLVNFSGRELVVVVTTASTKATANTLISRHPGEGIMVTLYGAAAYKNGSRRSVVTFEAMEMWLDVLGHSSALSNTIFCIWHFISIYFEVIMTKKGQWDFLLHSVVLLRELKQ